MYSLECTCNSVYSLSLSPPTPHAQCLVNSLPHQSLPDIFTSIVQSSFEEKLKILDAVDLPERFDAAQALIQRQITVCNHSDECLYQYSWCWCVYCIVDVK